MDSFISFMQLRTAIPFGYAIYAILWLLFSFWAVKNIIQCIWTKKYREKRLYLASALLLFNLVYLYFNIAFGGYLEFNPHFTRTDIIGEWQDGDSKIVFQKDGKLILNIEDSYQARLNVKNGDGYWQRYFDFNIQISNTKERLNSNDHFLRVIVFNGKYRIIIDDFDDPDLWDGGLDFVKKEL